MKELKKLLKNIPHYYFEVCFYEENFIIVRVTDRDFRFDFELMQKLNEIATTIRNKYNIRIEFSTLEFYKHLNFEMV